MDLLGLFANVFKDVEVGEDRVVVVLEVVFDAFQNAIV